MKNKNQNPKKTSRSKSQKEILFVHIVSYFHLTSLAGSPALHQLEERKLQYHIVVGIEFYCFAITIRQVLTQLMRHNFFFLKKSIYNWGLWISPLLKPQTKTLWEQRKEIKNSKIIKGDATLKGHSESRETLPLISWQPAWGEAACFSSDQTH